MTTLVPRETGYVDDNGAIRLSPIIVADGHVGGVVARIVTHIHQDHIVGIRRSIREIPLILATPLTHDLLQAHGYPVPPSRRIDASYHAAVRIDDYRVKLHRANHIPGAAEVTVEHPDGRVVGYTGDFKLPGTEILRDLDVLVLDATYGMPEWKRPWQVEIEYLLADIVNEALMTGPVRLYGYNGKMEEVMLLLRRMGVTAPFIIPRRKRSVIRVLENHSYSIGDVAVEGTPECLEARRSGWYVEFLHYNLWRRRRRDRGAVNILLTGWEFSAPYRRVGPRDWIVSFSDHADFTQLVEYVEEARPRLLVVDGKRGGEAAHYFARFVEKKLGLRATVEPRLI
jgi:putative mRNA 3-end processing factor